MHLIHVSSALLISFVVNFIPIFLLFQIGLINQFTYGVTLKSFLKEEYLVLSISRSFPTFTFFPSGAVSETLKITCFFPLSLEAGSEFASTTFVFHCSHSFGSCNSHSGPYHQFIFKSLADFPHVGISAALCFVYLCIVVL